ncbi:MAG: aminotransferase class III-fold pyridoxal phosphate-dependent enzyme, partial [Rhodospirillales bacterium]|nr:aminotransferase class III-fold pyridoxal phosphate-dependent enzyme [Rhodospirillales bacterium]
AGCAVMETIAAPGFLERVAQMGAYLADRLTALSAKHGCGGVRGQGLLLALDVERPVGPAVVELALARGLLLNAPRPDSLRFMPALTIGTAEVEEMIEVLDAVLGEVTAG